MYLCVSVNEFVGTPGADNLLLSDVQYLTA